MMLRFILPLVLAAAVTWEGIALALYLLNVSDDLAIFGGIVLFILTLGFTAWVLLTITERYFFKEP